MYQLDSAVSEDLSKLLSTVEKGNKLQTPMDFVSTVRKITDITGLISTEPLLPLLLSFNGSPLTMHNHFPLSPLFQTDAPMTTILMNGRQTGKSVATAASLYLNSVLRPNLSSLYVTPLQEQMKRFSINYMRALIDNAVFKSYLSNKCTNTITQRSFTNESRILFSFASVNADRVRGVNADLLCYDELQDFSFDVLPVIAETLSAAEYPRTIYTGTPKTEDNTLSYIWRKSSQAEWWIKCTHCGFMNIPSREYHLEGMIGPLRDDISEENPAVVCYQCQKPISPRTGRWVHRYPKRRMESGAGTGYHVPQILMPLHYANPLKWATLLAKKKDLPDAIFWNEVLGEPMDTGQTLVSMKDLQAAGCLGYKNDPNRPDPEVLRRRNSGAYEKVVLSIDWAGGGLSMTSYTAVALMGIDYNGNIDVLWGKRFSAGIDHQGEAMAILELIRYFSPHVVVHDYSGAGVVRESILIQSGVPADRIMPITYRGPSRQGLINYLPPVPQHPRGHYAMDKTRGILYTVHSLKAGQLRFFEYDGGSGSKNAAGMSLSLMDDFLALIDEKMTSNGSEGAYVIRRIPTKADDFAQAVTMGCVGLWHLTGHFPNFSLSVLDEHLVLSRDIIDAGPNL